MKDSFDIDEKNQKQKELLFDAIIHDDVFRQKNILQNSFSNNRHSIYYYIIPIFLIGISVTIFTIVDAEILENDSKSLSSSYLIQNLSGDTMDTWQYWRLVEGESLIVNVINADKYPEKFEVAKESILSTEQVEIDNNLMHKGRPGTFSTYYLGWNGALADLNSIETRLQIPTKLDVVVSSRMGGDITLELSPFRSGDGYAGYTNLVVDDARKEILKAHITIFDINNLDDESLRTIVRHELGHALGLGHTSASEDLMHSEINTPFPFISPCNFAGMIKLYDGQSNFQIECDI